MLRRGITVPLGRAHRGAADRAADRQGDRASRSTRWRRSSSWRRCGATTAAPICSAWVALALGAVLVARALARTCSAALAAAAPRRRRIGGDQLGNASAVSEALHHIPRLPRLPVAGVPAAAVVHGAALPEHRLRPVPAVRDLRRTRLGGVRLVRRVLPPLGVRRDPRSRCVARRSLGAGRRGASGAGVRAQLRSRRSSWCSMPVAVVAGFEAAYYTTGARPVIAEFGRYAFPAIGPLAVLVVGALHAFGRRAHADRRRRAAGRR